MHAILRDMAGGRFAKALPARSGSDRARLVEWFAIAPLQVFGLGVVMVISGCTEKGESKATGQPGTNTAMVIEPNLSVGKVRAGMTMAEVVKELGEPQRRSANALEYKRLGLAVMPGADGIVQVVMCGDVTGLNGPFAKTFSGRTKEGIGMYSTRGDLIKAFGEPTQSDKMLGGIESMKYASQGITFTLESSKVYHMIVRLPGRQEPDRTVTLEQAPAQK